MQGKAKRQRQKRCKCCDELFHPDVRTKGRQKYCSNPECQRKRQRQNEKDWRKRNPECVEYQYQQTRQRMQKIRSKQMFDKSKVILTQIVGTKPDKCYLTHGSKWLYVRLTKASPLSKQGSLGDNRNMCKRVANRLPKGRLYDLTCILE